MRLHDTASPGRAATAAAILASAAILCSGCATPLRSARENLYLGRLAEAERNLDKIRVAERDRVLFLMERGTVRQARDEFEASSRDFIEAADLLEKSETYSVSKGASSLVVNDTVQTFRGAPYERTLLHAMTARNHLALERWDDAAVEARRIIESMSPEQKKDYPEDAFSRYIAGFALEMIDDPSNAAIQYRLAGEAAKGVRIEPTSGALFPAPPAASTNGDSDVSGPAAESPPADAFPPPASDPSWRGELVCFVLLGRTAEEYEWWGGRWAPGAGPYAEIFAGDRYLGRTWPLADTTHLAFETEQKEAARKAAKTAARVVLKHALSEYVARESRDEGLGSLISMLLIQILEQPDARRWETLPRWFHVGRFPCPEAIDSLRVVLRSPNGEIRRSEVVNGPLPRRRSTRVLLYRDLPKPPTAPSADP